jgi:cytochrome c553
MKKIVFLLALCSTITAFAAGDYQAGQEKSTVCAACHGAAGISINPAWPSLAGQHAAYLVKQLHDFKNIKTRNAPTMTPMVANLTEQDMNDLAAFYAHQPLPEGSTPQKYLKRGEQLYRGGDFSKHITACIACHGPAGLGNAQANFPVLSGQQAAYTVQQLQAFKDKKRSNDLNSIMRDISARMSMEEMQAVANYVAGLH